MSRIGKLPVAIPAGVKVTVAPDVITVEGPKGKLDQKYNNLVKIEAGTEVVVKPADESKAANAAQGLYRNLINNMVTVDGTLFAPMVLYIPSRKVRPESISISWTCPTNR